MKENDYYKHKKEMKTFFSDLSIIKLPITERVSSKAVRQSILALILKENQWIPTTPSRSSAYFRDKAINRFMGILLIVLFVFTTSSTVFSQSSAVNKEFGVTAGAFTNFPANKNYLKENNWCVLYSPLYPDRST